MLDGVKVSSRIVLWLVVAAATSAVVYFALNTAGGEVNNPSDSAPTPLAQSTIESAGGLVIVFYGPEEVRLASVVPHPGFAYDVKDEGPPEVRVEFESGRVKVDVRAHWDGELITEIDEGS